MKGKTNQVDISRSFESDINTAKDFDNLNKTVKSELKRIKAILNCYKKKQDARARQSNAVSEQLLAIEKIESAIFLLQDKNILIAKNDKCQLPEHEKTAVLEKNKELIKKLLFTVEAKYLHGVCLALIDLNEMAPNCDLNPFFEKAEHAYALHLALMRLKGRLSEEKRPENAILSQEQYAHLIKHAKYADNYMAAIDQLDQADLPYVEFDDDTIPYAYDISSVIVQLSQTLPTMLTDDNLRLLKQNAQYSFGMHLTTRELRRLGLLNQNNYNHIIAKSSSAFDLSNVLFKQSTLTQDKFDEIISEVAVSVVKFSIYAPRRTSNFEMNQTICSLM